MLWAEHGIQLVDKLADWIHVLNYGRTLAEGAPAESYRDDGNRGLFDNPDPPRFAAANMPAYAPVLTGGPEVKELWHRLLLRSGDLLLLERKASWLEGIGIRIRRIALKSVAPRAVVDGPSIFDADLGHEIDNMEGIDAHVTEEGDTVLTMVSDDNFSMIQRTLLLQFTLVE